MPASAPVEVLVLVDLQRAFVSGAGAVPDAEHLLEHVRNMLARARTAGALVIHLQNDGATGSVNEPGQTGWGLAWKPRSGEPVLRKTTDDGFVNTALGQLLERAGATRISIAGVQSERCVPATARAALARGFSVVLAHDAHATYPVPARDGFGSAAPASFVARVAEWSLGDEVELVASAESVDFCRPGAAGP